MKSRFILLLVTVLLLCSCGVFSDGLDACKNKVISAIEKAESEPVRVNYSIKTLDDASAYALYLMTESLELYLNEYENAYNAIVEKIRSLSFWGDEDTEEWFIDSYLDPYLVDWSHLADERYYDFYPYEGVRVSASVRDFGDAYDFLEEAYDDLYSSAALIGEMVAESNGRAEVALDLMDKIVSARKNLDAVSLYLKEAERVIGKHLQE